jgi:hypothetical protein
VGCRKPSCLEYSTSVGLLLLPSSFVSDPDAAPRRLQASGKTVWLVHHFIEVVLPHLKPAQLQRSFCTLLQVLPGVALVAHAWQPRRLVHNHVVVVHVDQLLLPGHKITSLTSGACYLAYFDRHLHMQAADACETASIEMQHSILNGCTQG